MKKTYVLVSTYKGNMFVRGYDLGNGLYVHKLITPNTLGCRLTKDEFDKQKVLDITKSSYWTITHKSGMAVKQFYRTPIKLKEVIWEISNKISHLDWNRDSKELETADYRNAVREMHGF